MRLEILTPENTLLSDEVSLVTLPGVCGEFTVLDRHASLISALNAGVVKYKKNNQSYEISISSGFVEINNNLVSVCVEASI